MPDINDTRATIAEKVYQFNKSNLKFIGPAVMRWRGAKLNNITVLNFAEDENDRGKIELESLRTVPNKDSYQLRFECIPAILERASFHRSQVYLAEQTLLAGAAGKRARSQYALKNKETRQEFSAALSSKHPDNPSVSPEWVSEPESSVPICLDCRNVTNYYHFVSETLAALSSVARVARNREINVHIGNVKTAKDGFAYKFLQSAFPELKENINFVSDLSPVTYQQCIYPFATDHMFYMLNKNAWTPMEVDSVPENLREMCDATEKERNVFRFLSFDGGLETLRNRCMRLAAGHAYKPARKIIIGRRESGSRIRSGESWALLKGRLKMNGFVEIFFEDMDAMQQVRTMRDASVVVAAHGAGMTNMLFASHDAHVIEVGNIETTGGRLAVFHQIAQVSGCRYSVALVDRGVAQVHSNGQRVLAPISPSTQAIDNIVQLAIS